MDFTLEISRDNVTYYNVDLFPKQQLDYDLDIYDTVEIDKVKIPFYTDLRIPLTDYNKTAVVFDYDPSTSTGADFPKDDFYFRLFIYGNGKKTILGILNVESVEYNSGEPYLKIVLKDFISKYLSDIKDTPLGEIYDDSYYTTPQTLQALLTAEAGTIGSNPDYTKPIAFPYVDFCNDVHGKFGYAARQFFEYGPGMNRTGMMPVFSVTGFLEYLRRYIETANFDFRIDSHLFGIGAYNGSPYYNTMEPEKLHMIIPSNLMADKDTNTRTFSVLQSPAWAGTNQSLNSTYDYGNNVKLITTQYFGNMETAGHYGTDAEGNPLYGQDASGWAEYKRMGFYPDDADEGIRGFVAPKVSFNAAISLTNGEPAVVVDPQLEIPIVDLDKLVTNIYTPTSDMRFKPYVSIYEDGLIVKKIPLQDVNGDDIILTMANVISVDKGYSNKDTASAPYDYFDAGDGNPTILAPGFNFYDMLKFEPFLAYLPDEELFINSGSRYSINYFIEPLDGELDISYASAYDNANPHNATGITQSLFGVNDIDKAITRLGSPDGSSGTYGTLNLTFTANQDTFVYELDDLVSIQDSILQSCPFTVSDVLLNILKRFDCNMLYDYDDNSGEHVLRIDPIALTRTGTTDIKQYVDDIKSYKISNGGDKVKLLTLNNKDYGLFFDDENNDDRTVGSTQQTINAEGISEIEINFDSSIYYRTVAGDISDDYTLNENFQNGAFSANELGFTSNVFTQNKDVGFRFAYLDKPLYSTNLLRPQIVLKGLRQDAKMQTEVQVVYSTFGLSKHIFAGRLFHFNTAGWNLMFEDEDGVTTDTYDNIFAISEKIAQSTYPKIEFNMVVPTDQLSNLNFFLDEFVCSPMTAGTIYVKSANGEVFEDYAYLTIEGLLR